ncbi:hypothetical protein I6N90_19390 [Paenibacillus sp. GSMTC-2017]|uniref:hypothetical protein n=1 Tax=Paenibacillus sp. GSMTC-2017 TaxID=2794350 RepID=UPI0018D81AC3|nr:hypothetical protein [Paenibacillus sp. GSMTC-2017]MBH5319968.1 hypothetical protein [Paenibacillus sp. GSMTC-2017]
MHTSIIIIPALLIVAILFSIFYSQTKPKKQVWFGVTFPFEALKDERLTALQKHFVKSYVGFVIAYVVTVLPLLWLGDNTATAFIYLCLWLVAVAYTSTVPFKQIHHKAAMLKRDNGWFVGKQKTVVLDKEIAHYSGMKPLSPYLFLVPALMSVPLIIVSAQNDNYLLRLTGIASILMTGVIVLLSLSFTHSKQRAYSRNALPNIAINQAARRYWSVFWLTLSIFEVVNAFIAYYVLKEGTALSPSLWTSGIAMVSLVPLFGIYFVHSLIRDLEYRLAHTDGKRYIADSDEYWRHGMTYYNPDHSSTRVEKRTGIGSTLNTATAAGKMIYYGKFIVFAAAVIPVMIILIRAESTAPLLLIDDKGSITIKDTDYPFHFHKDHIQELKIADVLPSGFRANGTATSAYARGNFKLSELGPAKLYVFKKSPPFIVMKLEDSYVVYNDKNPATTKTLFEQLEKQIEK